VLDFLPQPHVLTRRRGDTTKASEPLTPIQTLFGMGGTAGKSETRDCP
jgi:hypothetical protein